MDKTVFKSEKKQKRLNTLIWKPKSNSEFIYKENLILTFAPSSLQMYLDILYLILFLMKKFLKNTSTTEEYFLLFCLACM